MTSGRIYTLETQATPETAAHSIRFGMVSFDWKYAPEIRDIQRLTTQLDRANFYEAEAPGDDTTYWIIADTRGLTAAQVQEAKAIAAQDEEDEEDEEDDDDEDDT